jgi:hypothetical protein
MFSFFKKKAPIGEFWTWFDSNKHRLSAGNVADDTIFRQMRQQLRRIDRSLDYEVVLGEPN